jgi:transcriptional regulator with XRE-family HTH domain
MPAQQYIGSQLRAWMAAGGDRKQTTGERLADELLMSSRTVSYLRRGVTKARPATIKKLATYFGVTVEEFLRGLNETKQEDET